MSDLAEKKCPNCGAVGKTKFAHDIAEEVCQGGSRRYCNLPVRLMPKWRRMKEALETIATRADKWHLTGADRCLARRAIGRRR